MRSIFDDPSTTNQPAGHPAVQTEAMEVDEPNLPDAGLHSLLQPTGQDDVNSDIAAPPVKPRYGSNPRIEATPAITEERQSRISPVLSVPEQPNMECKTHPTRKKREAPLCPPSLLKITFASGRQHYIGLPRIPHLRLLEDAAPPSADPAPVLPPALSCLG